MGVSLNQFNLTGHYKCSYWNSLYINILAICGHWGQVNTTQNQQNSIFFQLCKCYTHTSTCLPTVTLQGVYHVSSLSEVHIHTRVPNFMNVYNPNIELLCLQIANFPFVYEFHSNCSASLITQVLVEIIIHYQC